LAARSLGQASSLTLYIGQVNYVHLFIVFPFTSFYSLTQTLVCGRFLIVNANTSSGRELCIYFKISLDGEGGEIEFSCLLLFEFELKGVKLSECILINWGIKFLPSDVR